MAHKTAVEAVLPRPEPNTMAELVPAAGEGEPLSESLPAVGRQPGPGQRQRPGQLLQRSWGTTLGRAARPPSARSIARRRSQAPQQIRGAGHPHRGHDQADVAQPGPQGEEQDRSILTFTREDDYRDANGLTNNSINIHDIITFALNDYHHTHGPTNSIINAKIDSIDDDDHFTGNVYFSFAVEFPPWKGERSAASVNPMLGATRAAGPGLPPARTRGNTR